MFRANKRWGYGPFFLGFLVGTVVLLVKFALNALFSITSLKWKLSHIASTRTKDDIETIRHLYTDLDHAGTTALEEIEGSSLVPRPNYVLNTSEDKYQVVWKVEDISLDDAEGLQRASMNSVSSQAAARAVVRTSMPCAPQRSIKTH